MKNYVKPMATIEEIEVRDIITASGELADANVEAAIKADMNNAESTANTIVFNW